MTSPAALELRNVTKRFGRVRAVDDVSFAIEKASLVALLGPSGCGKTTILRLIAGFDTTDAGKIFLNNTDASGLRPYQRNIGIVFQDYALFPHMTVQGNIGYGLRRRGRPKEAIAERTGEMLRLVRLEGMGGRFINELSGGQQQRVALARALATEPQVLLLDEPLSALDTKLRQDIRLELREILAAVEVTTLIVTHDQEEAMSMADRIIVLNEGRVMQDGKPSELYASPSHPFVADFLGSANWLSGRIVCGQDGTAPCFRAQSGLSFTIAHRHASPQEDCLLCLRPERISLYPSCASGAVPGSLIRSSARVIDAVDLGPSMHVLVQLVTGERIKVVALSTSGLSPRRGAEVQVAFDPADCLIFSQPH